MDFFSGDRLCRSRRRVAQFCFVSGALACLLLSGVRSERRTGINL
ncbi:hypothetical protein [Alistipes dispar]